MNLSLIKTQVKRELWEHKTGFVYAPLVATGIFLCLLAYLSFSFLQALNHGVMAFNGKIDLRSGAGTGYQIKGDDADAAHKIGALIADLSAGNAEILQIIFGSAVGVNFGILLIVAAIVLGVYNHSCLFDDRKNRDILFWRSMPVSETTNVLVKLAMLLFAFPLTALVLNLIVTLVTSITLTLYLLAKGVAIGSWLLALINSGALLLSFKLFIASLALCLALLPVVGFVLWASAYAKKSPFLLAALLPVALLVVDKVLQSYAGIDLYFIKALAYYGDFLAHVADFVDVTKATSGYREVIAPMLLAAGVGLVFVAGAIWLRNNRYEI
jgi:ABC-2 type transport system permease protein